MKITNVEICGLTDSLVYSGFPLKNTISFSELRDSINTVNDDLVLGCKENNKHFKRGQKLGNAPIGSGHDCFLKGIIVQCIIEAPCYWWPQFQRYHFADIISSQSKMHMITKFNIEKQCTDKTWIGTIKFAEKAVQMYNEGLIDIDELLSNIPQGLELTAGVTTNYLQLKTMYAQRKNHRLYMWNTVFREFVEDLPFAKELGLLGCVCCND